MKQSAESRVLEYIAANPDQSSAEMTKGLNISAGTLKPHLKKLALAHKVDRVLVSNPHGVGRQAFIYSVPKTKVDVVQSVTIAETPRVEQIIKPGRAGFVQNLPTSHTDLDQIISDFAHRIAESVVAQALPLIIPKLRAEMAKVVAEAASCVVERPGEPAAPKEAKKKLPSIFVGGLQPSATSLLVKEFDGVADLRFVTPEDHANVWKSKSAHADHVIIMSGFVGHKHVEAVQSTGIKPTLVHGGMTHLKDKIVELALK